MRPITVEQQDETQAVITSGVEPPEQVVTTGFARLTDGSEVAIAHRRQPAPAAPPAGGATTASAQGARNGGKRQVRQQ